MTKQEAIRNHKKLWNWVADETEKRKQCVHKTEYFEKNGITDIPKSKCFCCEYVGEDCKYCPLVWKDESANCKYCLDSEYGNWQIACATHDWEKAARFARIIANLSERK